MKKVSKKKYVIYFKDADTYFWDTDAILKCMILTGDKKDACMFSTKVAAKNKVLKLKKKYADDFRYSIVEVKI